MTVHGREEAVVLSAEEFRTLRGSMTGQALIDALGAFPYPDLDLDFRSVRTSAREVDL